MKRTTKLSLKLLSSAILAFFALTANAQEIKVKISDIKSAKGKLMLSVFKDSKSFDDEQAFKTLTFDKKTIANGKLTVSCKLSPGTYGFTLVDDENANGKIDKNMIGIPKEGFGFSNFYLTKMKKPSFNEFKFVVAQSDTQVEIRVKYL